MSFSKESCEILNIKGTLIINVPNRYIIWLFGILHILIRGKFK